jgi:oligopeptide transport system substrate-binding protein
MDTQNVFKYNEAAGITSLDPAFASSFENISAVNQIFNGLVQMDEQLNVIPCIAKSWQVSEDGLMYTFDLRNDVYFHDHAIFENGKGRRVINSRISSPGAWIFNDVDFSDKSDYSGFIAINDSTLGIHLKNPFPPFLGILTMQYCSVVPYEVIEIYENDFRNNPIGTGPFKFKTWKEGVKLVLVKNENYFEKEGDQQLPYLDAISVSFIRERQSEFMEFISGKFDMLSGVDAAYKDELLTEDGSLNPYYSESFIMESVPFLKTDYIGILVDEKLARVKTSPLRLKQVRQAINYGFSRTELIKYLRNNIGTPAKWGFVPKGMPSFDTSAISGYSYQPDKARKLLEQAGFPNGKDLPELTLSTTAMYQDISEFIQSQLGELGIRIKIEVLPAAIHMEQSARAQLPLFRKSWVADYPDAENYLALFYSRNFCPVGPNYTHFKSAAYDALYEKAKWITNDRERYKLYHQMEQIIMDEAPVITLYYDQAVRFISKKISGLEVTPMNTLSLKKVKKQQL